MKAQLWGTDVKTVSVFRDGEKVSVSRSSEIVITGARDLYSAEVAYISGLGLEIGEYTIVFSQLVFDERGRKWRSIVFPLARVILKGAEDVARANLLRRPAWMITQDEPEPEDILHYLGVEI